MGNQPSRHTSQLPQQKREIKSNENTKKPFIKKLKFSKVARLLPKHKKGSQPPSVPDTSVPSTTTVRPPSPIAPHTEASTPHSSSVTSQRNTILQPLSRRLQNNVQRNTPRTPRTSNVSIPSTSAMSSHFSSSINASSFSGLFSQIDVTSSIATESSFSRHSIIDDDDKALSPPPYTSLNSHRRSHLQVVRPHSSLLESNVALDSSVMLSSSISAASTTYSEVLQDPVTYGSHISAQDIEEQDVTIESSHSPIDRHRLYSLLQLAQSHVKAQEQQAQSSSSASPSDNVIQNPAAILQDAFEQAQNVNDSQDYAEVYAAVSAFADETNNPSALVWVAQCHLNGWGVPRDATMGFEQLKTLASLDIQEAYYPLACCYADGLGVNVDKNTAFQWFEKSSVCGNNLAQYRAGAMLAQGVGVAQDDAKAFAWFKKSADAGNKYGQYLVGLHYEQGLSVKEDAEKSKEYYLKSAMQDFPDAQSSLGIRLADDGNHKDAVMWLEKAVQNDNTPALLKLGMMYEEGQGVDRNYEVALVHYKAAANRDDPVAQYLLGLNYRMGDLGLEQNYSEALQYLQKSANAGFPSAQRVLGLMYSEGVGCQQDHEVAFGWFQKAAAHNDVRAIGLLGNCYEHGNGVQQDYEKALEYYKQAAEAGSDMAEFSMGQLLHMLKQLDEAFLWYTKAAKRNRQNARLMVARYMLHGWGNAPHDPEAAFIQLKVLADNEDFAGAYFWVGACYEEGGGVVQDMEKAFVYYLKSANSGDVDGEFQVALMLSNGHGVSVNRKEAFEWYTKAASKGHKTAQFSLGLFYSKGLEGIPLDLSKAQVLFQKAATQDLPVAINALSKLLMKQKKFEEAIPWLQKGSDFGDITSMRELAILYGKGVGVEQDKRAAFKLLETCAKAKDTQALFMLATYHHEGMPVEQNLEMALKLYKQAVAQGSSLAVYGIAQIYHAQAQYDKAYPYYRKASQDPTLQSTEVGWTSLFMVARYVLHYYNTATPAQLEYISNEEAFTILLELAEQHQYLPAYFYVAECCEQGLGVSQDIDDAIFWYQQTAEHCLDMAVESDRRIVHLQNMATSSDELECIPEESESDSEASQDSKLETVSDERKNDIEWLKEQVQQGSAEAMYYLAKNYSDCGDDDSAFEYYEMAAELDNVDSIRELGKCYHRGRGCIRDVPRAVQLYKTAAASKDHLALTLLGQIYERGFNNVIPRDPEAASQCYTAAMDYGSVNAIYLAAQMHHTRGEYEKAIGMYRTAADQGNVMANVMCARYALTGLGGVEKNQEQGFQTLLKIAKADCSEAFNSVAQCYEMGIGTEKNDAHALEWFLKSASVVKDANAMYHIGCMIEEGRGTGESPAEALNWYQLANETGRHRSAQYKIGVFHKEGLGGVTQDLGVAQLYFKKAADQGEEKAMQELAQLFWMQKSYSLALIYYEQAASLGVIEANFTLGKLYHSGFNSDEATIVPQDYASAFAYFNDASNKGDATSTIILGSYYQHGWHVEQNRNTALQIYEKAIEQGGGTLAQLAVAQLKRSCNTDNTTA
ncbi:hypothetical protein VKS41_003195 [Umbelopsis sp. WA50703]